MIQTVLKRDGRQVGYNEEKIKAAIRKAMIAAEVNDDEALIQRIADRIGMRGKSQMTVEAIQDMVENELMKSPYKQVARTYIKYRHSRNVARKAGTAIEKIKLISQWGSPACSKRFSATAKKSPTCASNPSSSRTSRASATRAVSPNSMCPPGR